MLKVLVLVMQYYISIGNAKILFKILYWYWQYIFQAVLVLVLPILFKITVHNRDAPIIGIGRLVRWNQPIVVYTVGKYKILFLLPKVNKHESAFHFW